MLATVVFGDHGAIRMGLPGKRQQAKGLRGDTGRVAGADEYCFGPIGCRRTEPGEQTGEGPLAPESGRVLEDMARAEFFVLSQRTVGAYENRRSDRPEGLQDP